MVADTIRDLKVARVGHGINARHDANLLAQLADTGVVLEVCPVSNMVLHAIPPGVVHPIAALRDAGVKVTVSTDDPPFFNSTMSAEFSYVSDTFGWGEDDLKALNQTALDAAFCDDATRAKITKRLETS